MNNEWKMVRVNAAFGDLMYWLERCERKGHLENCSDLVEPWEAFDYEYVDCTPPASAQDDAKVYHFEQRSKFGPWIEVEKPTEKSVEFVKRSEAPAAGDAQTAAARDVLAERQRQISAEGWTSEHDDTYTEEQMARAAVCYALPQGDYEIPQPPEFWPWDAAWWKPGDRRRELVKAGALILAEIERLDRAAIAQQSVRKGE